jgi:hypothetical protein
MPSTFTSRLKLERQASGENSGNWGNLVNYVFNRIDSTVRGYVSIDVAGSANVTLTSNNSTTNTDDSTTDDQVHNKIIELTGALTGDIYVFTDAVEGEYIIFNNTTGSQTLTFSNTGHAANGVVVTQGTKKLLYTTGTNVVDVFAGSGLLSEIVQDTTPQLGGQLDVNGNAIGNGTEELIKFVETGSAVNEFTITNNATGSNPILSATGDDTNIGIDLTTKGTGFIKFNDAAYNPEATLTDGATISWDAQAEPVAKVTLAGNRTMAAPTNGATGQFVSLLVIQDGTGTRTLTWNAVYEFASDTPPTLTATGDLGDLFVFRYNGTKWLEVGRNLALTLS